MSRHAYYGEHQSSITEDHSFIEWMLDVETEDCSSLILLWVSLLITVHIVHLLVLFPSLAKQNLTENDVKTKKWLAI
jgi:hypothetical protein